MRAVAVDRAGRASVASRLEAGEWLVLGAAGLLLLSLVALDWFALSVANQAVPDSGANAFESLDGPDQLLVVAALLAVAGPFARMFGLIGAREAAGVSGAAGLLSALVVAYVIISPPAVDAEMLTSFAGGIDAGLEARGGAFVALALAAGVVAASVRPITHAPDTPAAEAKPAPRMRATQPKAAPRQRAAKPKTARNRTAKPTPSASPGRLRLATATADDLVGVGFTATQAQRIVSYRDEEALVSKVADLKRVPGIAKPVLAELVKRLED